MAKRQLTDEEWNRRFEELHGAEMRDYYHEPKSYLGSSLSPHCVARTIHPVRLNGECL